MSDAVVILNGHRQVIGVNRGLLGMLDLQQEQVLGRRLGELVGCTHAPEGPDGCGTSPDCETCGAIDAILASQRSRDKVTRECRVSLQEPVAGALDLSVSATAVDTSGERFSICVVRDISDDKRLAVLARLFFHDVINTAGGIQGYAELLRESVHGDATVNEELGEIAELADQLVEDIRAERDLTFAESGDLVVELEPVDAGDLLRRVRAWLEKHPVARGRSIESGSVWEGTFRTDRRLLMRILGNMTENALEAIARGQVVTLECLADGDEVRFLVHNPGVMPREVQQQVFQRSFSTKARSGRGIGTHSMKLFGERYLGGRVAFESTPERGTVFQIRLPRSPSVPTAPD